MAQFNVPQFIEVESKIFGPLTFKQFVYIVGGAGILFLLYSFLQSFWLTALLGAPVIALSAGLAFLKIHGKPFIQVFQSAVKHFLGTNLYIWKKPGAAKIKKETAAAKKEESYLPKLTENKLQDLAWSLDVKEKIK